MKDKNAKTRRLRWMKSGGKNATWEAGGSPPDPGKRTPRRWK